MKKHKAMSCMFFLSFDIYLPGKDKCMGLKLTIHTFYATLPNSVRVRSVFAHDIKTLIIHTKCPTFINIVYDEILTSTVFPPASGHKRWFKCNFEQN